MYFLLNGKQISTLAHFKEILPLLLSAEQRYVPKPKIISSDVERFVTNETRIDVLPYECAYIDTDINEKSRDPCTNDPLFFHVHKVQKGVSLYFYNDKNERLMMVMSDIVNIPDWAAIFSHFKHSNDLNVIITGGAESKLHHAETQHLKNNFSRFLTGLYNFASRLGNPININVAGLGILANNTLTKDNLAESVTPYLYHTLNMMSLRYCGKKFKYDISFSHPSKNFESDYVGNIEDLYVATNLVGAIFPREVIPFTDLPYLGSDDPSQYLQNLAHMLFTKQAMKIFKNNLFKNSGPDLNNFMVNCDTHSYVRVNNYYQPIPYFHLRIARNLEQLLTKQYSLLAYDARLRHLRPNISLSDTIMIFLHANRDNYQALRKAQLASFTSSQLSPLDSKILDKPSESLYRMLLPFKSSSQALDSVSDDLVCTLEHYISTPESFDYESPLAQFGLFSKNDQKHLGYCKYIIEKILDKSEGLSVKAYGKENILDIICDDTRLPTLRGISKIIDRCGTQNKISSLGEGIHAIRLRMSASVAKSIEESFVIITTHTQPQSCIAFTTSPY